MRNPSFNVIFNKLDPSGFNDDDRNIIDNTLNTALDIIGLTNVGKIIKTSTNDYKIEYEISYIGDYKNNNIIDFYKLYKFTIFPDKVIRPQFNEYISKKYKINISVDYSNMYIIDGIFVLKALFKSEKDEEQLGEEFCNAISAFSNTDRTHNVVMCADKVTNESELDGVKFNQKLTIFSTSLIRLSIAITKILDYKEPVKYNIEYKDEIDEIFQ